MAEFDEYEYLEKQVDGEEGPGHPRGRDDDRGRFTEEEYEEERQAKRRSRQGPEDELAPGSGGKDRERERERSRERERDDGEREPRDRDRDRDREKEYRNHRDGRDRDYRGRERDHRRHRDYERRDKEQHRGKKKEEKEEPEADPERDQRTVFAYQINLKADERDVYEFFSRAGKVRDVRLIMDRNSRRSKGVGYIEFYDAMSVPMAIALRGQLLLGTPVMVKPSEAEKNLAAQAAAALPAAATATGLPGALPGLPGVSLLMPALATGSKRLYISNLHVNMNADQLKQVVEPFGALDSVQVPTDATSGQCKGFGLVTYSKIEDARIAQQYLNDMEVAGLSIKVQFIPEGFNLPGFGEPGPGVNPGELDDDEGGGLSLSAQSRVALMQKLDRSAAGGAALLAPNPLAAAAGILPGLAGAGLPGVVPLPGLVGLANSLPGLGTVLPVEDIGTPSQFLLLKNMFKAGQELDDDFAQDIQEDVEAECSKFGEVLQVHVDRASTSGHVYVKFADVDGASKARQTLNGRWFAGQPIAAKFLSAAEFDSKVSA